MTAAKRLRFCFAYVKLRMRIDEDAGKIVHERAKRRQSLTNRRILEIAAIDARGFGKTCISLWIRWITFLNSVNKGHELWTDLCIL